MVAEGYDKPDGMVQAGLKALKSKYNIKSGSKVVVVAGLKKAKGGFDSSVRVVEI